MSSNLFETVQTLAQEFEQKKPELEEARQTEHKQHMEAACPEAMTAIMEGHEETIKEAATNGRQDTLIYKWRFGDQVKFGEVFLRDLLNKGDLLAMIQENFDKLHGENRFKAYSTMIGRADRYGSRDDRQFGVFVSWNPDSFERLDQLIKNTRERFLNPQPRRNNRRDNRNNRRDYRDDNRDNNRNDHDQQRDDNRDDRRVNNRRDAPPGYRFERSGGRRNDDRNYDNRRNDNRYNDRRGDRRNDNRYNDRRNDDDRRQQRPRRFDNNATNASNEEYGDQRSNDAPRPRPRPRLVASQETGDTVEPVQDQVAEQPQPVEQQA